MARRKFTNRMPVDALVDILVADPDEFNADRDNLRGRRIERGYVFGGGRHFSDDETFRRAQELATIEYAVYSYGDVIAYLRYVPVHERIGNFNAHQWSAVPPNTGSATTAKHVNKVRNALSRINGGI